MLSSRSSVSDGQSLCVGAPEELLQPLGDVDEPRLVDDELPRQVHQVIEPIALDPDRLGDLGLARLASGLGASRPGRRGLARSLTGDDTATGMVAETGESDVL